MSNIKERNKLKPDENQIAQSLRPFLFKSFYGIMIIGLPLLPFMSSKVNFNQGLMFSIVMLIWGIILFGPQLYFFEVSDNVLIVKHQIFFWYKRVFKIEDCCSLLKFLQIQANQIIYILLTKIINHSLIILLVLQKRIGLKYAKYLKYVAFMI